MSDVIVSTHPNDKKNAAYDLRGQSVPNRNDLTERPLINSSNPLKEASDTKPDQNLLQNMRTLINEIKEAERQNSAQNQTSDVRQQNQASLKLDIQQPLIQSSNAFNGLSPQSIQVVSPSTETDIAAKKSSDVEQTPGIQTVKPVETDTPNTAEVPTKDTAIPSSGDQQRPQLQPENVGPVKETDAWSATEKSALQNLRDVLEPRAITLLEASEHGRQVLESDVKVELLSVAGQGSYYANGIIHLDPLDRNAENVAVIWHEGGHHILKVPDPHAFSKGEDFAEAMKMHEARVIIFTIEGVLESEAKLGVSIQTSLKAEFVELQQNAGPQAAHEMVRNQVELGGVGPAPELGSSYENYYLKEWDKVINSSDQPFIHAASAVADRLMEPTVKWDECTVGKPQPYQSQLRTLSELQSLLDRLPQIFLPKHQDEMTRLLQAGKIDNGDYSVLKNGTQAVEIRMTQLFRQLDNLLHGPSSNLTQPQKIEIELRVLRIKHGLEKQYDKMLADPSHDLIEADRLQRLYSAASSVVPDNADVFERISKASYINIQYRDEAERQYQEKVGITPPSDEKPRRLSRQQKTQMDIMWTRLIRNLDPKNEMHVELLERLTKISITKLHNLLLGEIPLGEQKATLGLTEQEFFEMQTALVNTGEKKIVSLEHKHQEGAFGSAHEMTLEELLLKHNREIKVTDATRHGIIDKYGGMPFYITKGDRQKHAVVFGGSGEGKTKFGLYIYLKDLNPKDSVFGLNIKDRDYWIEMHRQVARTHDVYSVGPDKTLYADNKSYNPIAHAGLITAPLRSREYATQLMAQEAEAKSLAFVMVDTALPHNQYNADTRGLIEEVVKIGILHVLNQYGPVPLPVFGEILADISKQKFAPFESSSFTKVRYDYSMIAEALQTPSEQFRTGYATMIRELTSEMVAMMSGGNQIDFRTFNMEPTFLCWTSSLAQVPQSRMIQRTFLDQLSRLSMGYRAEWKANNGDLPSYMQQAPLQSLLFLVDEAGMAGNWLNLPSHLATWRDQDISSVILTQHMKSLVNNYGENGALDIIVNSLNWIFRSGVAHTDRPIINEVIGNLTQILEQRTTTEHRYSWDRDTAQRIMEVAAPLLDGSDIGKDDFFKSLYIPRNGSPILVNVNDRAAPQAPDRKHFNEPVAVNVGPLASMQTQAGAIQKQDYGPSIAQGISTAIWRGEPPYSE